MPPKKKPVQAGKFKPLKRPTKKTAAAEPSASAAATSSSNDAKPSAKTASAAASKPASNSRSRSPKGRGAGRGGRRGGRGGRGGRFIAPTGQAFFTGNAIAGGSNNASAAAGARAARGGGPVDPVSAAIGPTAPKLTLTREAAKSAAAAARAREGEGEEIVVMEMDLEDDDEGGKKKKSVLEQDRPEREGPSLFDDEVDETPVDIDAFEYDSDSSVEEAKQHRKGNVNFRMAPNQLPFPVAPHQQSMYDCQDTTQTSLMAEEKKSADVEMPTEQQSSFLLSDPVLESPFIDVNSASDSLKKLELDSWFVMKFPTRLPHLDAAVSSGGSKINVKSEEGDEPDLIGSSNDANNNNMMPATVSVGAGPSTTAEGYDDTLKDIPPGRYGRIVVRKSGRTELIVGGGDSGEPEVRMLIHEGLQCGFRQEAVSIDPDESTFVQLGNVNKSIVVTPDIEKAFALS